MRGAMEQQYYLVSSLPMLDFESAPPLSEDEFLDACVEWLPEDAMERLRSLSLLPPEEISRGESAIDKWYVWETRLRNALAGRRARREGGGGDRAAEKFLRENLDFFSEIEDAVQEAFSKPSPLDREDVLDKARWRMLDSVEAGHPFDFDKLCVYKLKLLLLAKRASRDTRKGEEYLEAALTGEDLLLPVAAD